MKWYDNIKILLSTKVVYGLIKIIHLYYKIMINGALPYICEALCILCIVIVLHKCNYLYFLHMLFHFMITTVLEVCGVSEIFLY